MTPEMKVAMDKAFEKLNVMTPKQLKKELDKHKNGFWAKVLMESGAADIMYKEMVYGSIDNYNEYQKTKPKVKINKKNLEKYK